MPCEVGNGVSVNGPPPTTQFSIASVWVFILLSEMYLIFFVEQLIWILSVDVINHLSGCKTFLCLMCRTVLFDHTLDEPKMSKLSATLASSPWILVRRCLTQMPMHKSFDWMYYPVFISQPKQHENLESLLLNEWMKGRLVDWWEEGRN